jgi:hypothetical protein
MSCLDILIDFLVTRNSGVSMPTDLDICRLLYLWRFNLELTFFPDFQTLNKFKLKVLSFEIQLFQSRWGKVCFTLRLGKVWPKGHMHLNVAREQFSGSQNRYFDK